MAAVKKRAWTFDENHKEDYLTDWENFRAPKALIDRQGACIPTLNRLWTMQANTWPRAASIQTHTVGIDMAYDPQADTLRVGHTWVQEAVLRPHQATRKLLEALSRRYQYACLEKYYASNHNRQRWQMAANADQVVARYLSLITPDGWGTRDSEVPSYVRTMSHDAKPSPAYSTLFHDIT